MEPQDTNAPAPAAAPAPAPAAAPAPAPAAAPVKESSLREQLEAAWDTEEKKANRSETPEEAAKTRDPETGRFVKGQEKTGQAPVRAPAAAPAPAPAAGPAAPVVKPGELQPLAANRAPQAWRAPVRELWGKLPPEVQQEVARREREMAERLQRDAPMREFAEDMRRVVAPFEAQFKMSGQRPAAVVEDLLRTAHQLGSAPPWGKAQVAAGILRAYGVDIGMLADALDGAQGPGGQPAPTQQAGDPRVDQLMSMFQQREAEYAAQVRQQELQEHQELVRGYEKFAEGHEFFEDVRQDMANIVRLKAAQGLDVSDEEAYKMSIALHPELAELVRQREEAKRATSPAGPTERAAAAAGSVRPGSAVRAAATDGTDLRATLNAAWDKHSQQA